MKFKTQLFMVIFLLFPALLLAEEEVSSHEDKMEQAHIHYNLAEARLRGSVQIEDYVQAIQDYRKSQALGSVMASDRLVNLMRTLPIDPTLQSLYRDTMVNAKEGGADAQYTVAQMLEFGIGVNGDFSRALFWYKSADELGHGAAKNRLADLYTEGLLSEDDSVSEQKVFEWIESAAKNNQSEAQFKLANMYLLGSEIVVKDEAKAFYWFEKSAKLGFPEAQMQSGLMLKDGQGVKQDYDKALYWFEKAAAQGYQPAHAQVKEVNTILDDIFLQNFKYK